MDGGRQREKRLQNEVRLQVGLIWWSWATSKVREGLAKKGNMNGNRGEVWANDSRIFFIVGVGVLKCLMKQRLWEFKGSVEVGPQSWVKSKSGSRIWKRLRYWHNVCTRMTGSGQIEFPRNGAASGRPKLKSRFIRFSQGGCDCAHGCHDRIRTGPRRTCTDGT